MEKNFLISGFGRSGTKFLSGVMNMSEEWTVLHEPRGASDEERLTRTMLNDFEKDFYGEVNSRMRFRYYDVKVKKRGLILRDTKEIVTSIANRKGLNGTLNLIRELNKWYKQFHQWLENDPSIILIEFDKMTSDREYLKTILNKFDINDVDVNQIDLTKKVNVNKKIKFSGFDSLSDQIKNKYFSYEWK